MTQHASQESDKKHGKNKSLEPFHLNRNGSIGTAAGDTLAPAPSPPQCRLFRMRKTPTPDVSMQSAEITTTTIPIRTNPAVSRVPAPTRR